MRKDFKKVAIAMSGGVDSSVAAAILQNQGYDCIGIFMKFWSEPPSSSSQINADSYADLRRYENKCCSQEAFRDARRVAQILGFPIYTLNFKQSFKKAVVDNFLNQYQKGLTPNPCIFCNQFIKFDLLLKKAKILGCDYLATGHYTRISSKFKVQSSKLLMAKDKKKDQSYFLYTLTQKQLKHLLFPIGDYTKKQVRQLAKKFSLPVFEKSESQEICFVSQKYPDEFLKKYLKLKRGPIITLDGKKVGEHQGLPLYTLGQRRGIKIGGIGPFYVVRKDFKNNILIITNNSKDPELFSKEFKVKNVNWIAGEIPRSPFKCQVRVRHQAELIECCTWKRGFQVGVKLEKPLRAVTPGQSAVFYRGEEVLGGGVIANSL